MKLDREDSMDVIKIIAITLPVLFKMRDTSYQKLKKLLPNLKQNILLKNYTTLKVGGPAQYFSRVDNKEDLISAIKKAKEKGLDFFILGRGSNLLVSDKGFKGLIIKMQNSKIKVQDSKIEVGAGLKLTTLIKTAAEHNLSGLEWAAGIPGTVGGAIYGNAGAFKKSMKDSVEEVEVFDVKKETIRKLKKKDCNFSYRESLFKKNKDLIILSALLKLKKENKNKIKERIAYYNKYRKERHPLEFASAGSIFRNPDSCSAGELIEKCGLKGKKINGAQISEKHANFIVNLGGATAKDIMALINLAKRKVKHKFNITLKEEIQYLGFKN